MFSDPITKLVLRLPDGKKEVLEWPCTSKIKAITLFIEQNYSELTKKSYKIICPYPRQNLLEIDSNLTLKAANLHPSVILHVHTDE